MLDLFFSYIDIDQWVRGCGEKRLASILLILIYVVLVDDEQKTISICFYNICSSYTSE